MKEGLYTQGERTFFHAHMASIDEPNSGKNFKRFRKVVFGNQNNMKFKINYCGTNYEIESLTSTPSHLGLWAWDFSLKPLINCRNL